MVAVMAKRRLADKVLEALPILDSKRRRKEREFIPAYLADYSRSRLPATFIDCDAMA